MKNSSLYRFSPFFPCFEKGDLLDFGLTETSLIETSRCFGDYLGVNKCFLKLETELPTGTMKDRITELMFCRFKKDGIRHYAQASTGNTSASLAWAMQKYGQKFKADIFVGEGELPYHNFEKPVGMRMHLLEGATYDQAVKYAEWFTKNVLKDESMLGGANSVFRHSASKLSYLEALWQLHRRMEKVDLVCQSISAGVGIIGADKALEDALAKKWIFNYPKIIVGQPFCANPIASCFQSGAKEYDQRFSICRPAQSLAWPIRRGNGVSTYPLIKDILDKSSGLALVARETEIFEAKQMLYGCEKINAGYASCVVMAGLHKKRKSGELKNSSCLIMVTGKDRPRHYITPVDTVIRKEDWIKVLT